MGDPKPRQMYSTQLLGSSFVVNRNFLLHNLMTTPLHEGNKVPTPLANNSMDQSTGDAAKKGGQNTSMKWDQMVIKGVIPCVAATAMAPLERVYTLMQCQNEILKTGRLLSPYKGMKDCFIRTIRHEGFFSLWRGNSVTVFLSLGVSVKAFTEPKNSPTMYDVPLPVLCLAIMFGNGFVHPFTYARVRLINDVKPITGTQFSLDLIAKPVTTNYNAAPRRQFSSAVDVVLKTIKCDGFGGLYRGYTPYCIGFFAYTLVDQAYDETYTKDKQNQKTRTFWASVESKCMLLGVAPVAVYPLGTVGKRMMTKSCEAYKYKGAMNAFFQIIRNEGVSSLYKGLTPHLISSFSKAGIVYGLTKFYKHFNETVV